MKKRHILTAVILLITFMAGCSITAPKDDKKETSDNAEVEVSMHDIIVETPDAATESEEMSAIYVEDSIGTVMSYNEYVIDYIDTNIGVMLKADKSVKDLSILSLNWEGIKADGSPVYDETEAVFCGDVVKGNGVLIWIIKPTDIPGCGISYRTASGEEKKFTLTRKDKDGSLVLSEFK